MALSATFGILYILIWWWWRLPAVMRNCAEGSLRTGHWMWLGIERWQRDVPPPPPTPHRPPIAPTVRLLEPLLCDWSAMPFKDLSSYGANYPSIWCLRLKPQRPGWSSGFQRLNCVLFLCVWSVVRRPGFGGLYSFSGQSWDDLFDGLFYFPFVVTVQVVFGHHCLHTFWSVYGSVLSFYCLPSRFTQLSLPVLHSRSVSLATWSDLYR